MEAVVDVIIPVYRGVEETRRCLEAVLAAPQCTPFELIVVDDASPEPAIRAQLDELAAAGRIRLLRHARNLGFVAAVNAGLALHPERDLVLLNSDTEVSGDWLDRLRAHAEAEPCVGTVTPFSNDASLCSYPRIAESNAMPFDSTPAELDALAARINAGRSIDLPTGVGFCLLIRREALDQVGGFDVERFGLGYGEEVDVCLRLEQAGYRHLLAGDVFVYHQGSVSFGAQAEQRKQRAQALIDAEYPDYQQRIQAFFAQDAGRPLRRRLDIARLRGIHPLVLFVCHDRGGGVERHVRDLTELLRSQVEVLVLQPHGPRLQRLIWSRDEEEFTVYLDLAQGYAEAIELLEALCIDRLHYHHVADFPIEVLKLPRDLDRPYDFTLHDFAVVCPQFHFATAQGRYCGERGLAHCRPCLTERPPPWPLQIEQWRVLWQDWLAAAERIICPSQDARARLARYWPALSSLHWPHPEPARLTWGNSPLSRQPPVKVLVLGAISAIKGFDLVDACAQDARQRDLPLFFRVLGPSAPSNAPWPESLLSIAGGYRDADLPDLIAAERPDVFFFPSQVPETFSYTLSMAMQTGWPILATRLGAFSERLAGYPLAQLLDPEAPVADWNQALLSCQPRDVTWCSGSKAARAAESYGQEYSARYLGVFSNQEICSVQEPLSDTFVLPAHQVFVSPEDQPPEPSLSQLYSGVVEYRDWRLQSELTRRIEETELALADAQWERRELRVQLSEAEAYARMHLGDEQRAHDLHVKHLEARIDAIHASTAWRLIKPLMELAHRQRQLRARWQKGLRAVRRRARFGRLHSRHSAWSFPILEHPLVSIIIMPVEHPSELVLCLNQVRAGLGDFAFEVLVPDTEAGDLAAALRETGIGGVTMVTTTHPEHFGAQANQIAARARGRYLLWLDSAIMLTRAALEAMLDQIQLPDVGMVVPKIRQFGEHGPLVAAGGILWQDGRVWCDGAGDDPAKPEFNYVRPIHTGLWSAVLVVQHWFHVLQGFDQGILNPHAAVVILCLRLQESGFLVVYQPDAEVYWSVDDSLYPRASESLLSPEQSATLVADWPERLAKCAPLGTPLLQARDPSNRWRVLLILPDSLPTLPGEGAEAGITWLSRLLIDQNMLTTSFSIVTRSGVTPPALLNLRQRGVEVLSAPYVGNVAETLDIRGPWLNEVLLIGLAETTNLQRVIRKKAPDARLSCLLLENVASTVNSSQDCQHWRRWQEKKFKEIMAFDRVIVSSVNDQETMFRNFPSLNSFIVHDSPVIFSG